MHVFIITVPNGTTMSTSTPTGANPDYEPSSNTGPVVGGAVAVVVVLVTCIVMTVAIVKFVILKQKTPKDKSR